MRWGALLPVLACLSVAGCAAPGPKDAAVADARQAPADPGRAARLQSVVMSMADDWNAALGESIGAIQREPGVDVRAMWTSQAFLRNGMGASLDIAVGPNPSVAILDMLVLASLQTWTLERNWAGRGVSREAAMDAVQQLGAARDSLWATARKHLAPGDCDRLAVLVDSWIEGHQDQALVSFVRLADFAADRNRLTLEQREEAAGLLREVEDVTTAVDDARLLGERALWYAARYPFVLGQQVELTSYRLQESLSKEMRTQRAEIVADIDRERDRLVRALDDGSRSLGPVMADARATVKDARELAVELERVVGAIDRLVGRFDHADPQKGLTVKDVEGLLRQAEASAVEARKLIESGDRLVGPDRLPSAVAAADTALERLVDRVLWGLGLLVIVLLAGMWVVLRYAARR